MLGVRVQIFASNGAYGVWPMTAGLDSGQASENITGPYDIANYERDVYAVCTNKAPMGPYRGVGRPSACFTIERLMDEIADELGLEPLEVRRRNVVRSYPHTTPTGLVFESGSSAESIDMIEEKVDWPRSAPSRPSNASRASTGGSAWRRWWSTPLSARTRCPARASTWSWARRAPRSASSPMVA